MTSPFLVWALRYQKAGLSIIPLRPRAKEPLIPWTEFQSRTMATEEIVQHWTRVPNANIGIVTGKISGIAVIDLDGPEGNASAIELGLRSTGMSLTGNGKHLWYKLINNGIVIQNAVKLVPGLDVRGEGGYVVAPPSISPNGKRYRWLGNGVVNAGFISQLQPFPEQALTVKNAAVGLQTVIKEESWIAKALEDLKDGNIDNTFVSILGRLRSDGYSAADAKAFLEPHAKRVGAEDGHLEAKIENIWNRYEPKSVGRIVEPFQQSGSMGEGTQLVIHTPADNDSWASYESRLAKLHGEVSELRSGYSKLDAMLTGGLKSERLFTVAALTGHGKTNFGIGLSKNLCEQRKVVLYFSTEFGYKKIWQRYIATLKDPNSFREHKFHVFDGFTPSLEQVEELIQRVKPDVFIFDYIQHVSKEKEKLTDFMKGCQFLQRKYNCQGLILAQLNRGADWIEDGKRIEPRLSMIEGSATIEQASSRVLLLSMSRQLPEYYEINGYLAKNDDGDTGLVQFALYRNPYHLEQL